MNRILTQQIKDAADAAQKSEAAYIETLRQCLAQGVDPNQIRQEFQARHPQELWALHEAWLQKATNAHN